MEHFLFRRAVLDIAFTRAAQVTVTLGLELQLFRFRNKRPRVAVVSAAVHLRARPCARRVLCLAS
jgi:hypothetical protein